MKNMFTMFCLSLALSVPAAFLPVEPAGAATPAADVASHAACQHCGMDREKFAHSRMLIEYDDGTTAATCSLH